MTTQCWLWSGAYYRSGYGQVWVPAWQRPTQAHRFVYEQLVGTIPDGKQIDHLCRIRGCVNPEHMRIVSCRENIMAEGSTCIAKRNADKTHCRKGHPYDEANTQIVPSGHRHCRTCKNQAKRRARSMHLYTK